MRLEPLLVEEGCDSVEESCGRTSVCRGDSPFGELTLTVEGFDGCVCGWDIRDAVERGGGGRLTLVAGVGLDVEELEETVVFDSIDCDLVSLPSEARQ